MLKPLSNIGLGVAAAISNLGASDAGSADKSDYAGAAVLQSRNLTGPNAVSPRSLGGGGPQHFSSNPASDDRGATLEANAHGKLVGAIGIEFL